MNEPLKTNRGWRIARYILMVLAILATLIAIFYTEEDLRGKWAWESCKRQFEAQGVVLDWNKYIPPSVPDDQNFYTYSTNFLEFKQLQTDAEKEAVKKIHWLNLDPFQPDKNAGANGRVPSFPTLDTSKTLPIIVTQIVVSPQAIAIEPSSNNLAVSFNDPAARARVQLLIQSTMGQIINGVQGFEFSQFQLTNIQPAQITMQADTPLSVADLAAFIPSDMTSDKIGEKGRLRVIAIVKPNIFQVQLTNHRITSAADYLAWSDQFVPGFDDIREALKRPYAIIPGDYSAPYQMPIPNFVMMRALAQTLGQRAQCYLLLGEPDKALHELTLVHDVCRILEKPPTGQPETLVEAMINVAIHGLYVGVIQEGFQRHEWQEPQLEALQEQLAQANLLPIVKRSFDFEMVAGSRTIETMSYPELKNWFSYSSVRDWKTSLVSLLEWTLIPRGWMYQNMVTSATLEYKQTGGFDSTDGIILPDKFGYIDHALNKIPMRYKFVAAMMIPNVTKAWQTTAYNQTLVNEAQIACALERCRLVHGEYPDTLDALVPGYIQTIPQDIIGGQPLHYRRTDDGKFLLYSVGWNERDDGGRTVLNQTETVVIQAGGDWVWLGGIK